MTYIESSALVSLFVPDRHTAAIRQWITGHQPRLAMSTFGAAEFASALSIGLRTGRLLPHQADRVLRVFDIWAASEALTLDLDAADHRIAATFVRRFDLGLRAPDALHVAICRRLALPMVTFDRRQEAAAQALGISCEAVA